jgi:hypothetical protein
MPHTHIIIHQGTESEILYRASDGMVIAGRSGTVVQFGENPMATEQRQFLDKSSAAAYLRKIADKDADSPAVIEDRDAERRIISPADAVGAGLRN